MHIGTHFIKSIQAKKGLETNDSSTFQNKSWTSSLNTDNLYISDSEEMHILLINELHLQSWI